MLIEIDSYDAAKLHGNLWDNHSNTITRAIGRGWSSVYVGDQCGTVRDRDGNYFDWWITDGRTEIRPAT